MPQYNKNVTFFIGAEAIYLNYANASLWRYSSETLPGESLPNHRSIARFKYCSLTKAPSMQKRKKQRCPASDFENALFAQARDYSGSCLALRYRFSSVFTRSPPIRGLFGFLNPKALPARKYSYTNRDALSRDPGIHYKDYIFHLYIKRLCSECDSYISPRAIRKSNTQAVSR